MDYMLLAREVSCKYLCWLFCASWVSVFSWIYYYHRQIRYHNVSFLTWEADDRCSLQEMHGKKGGSYWYHTSWSWRTLPGMRILCIPMLASLYIFTLCCNSWDGVSSLLHLHYILWLEWVIHQHCTAGWLTWGHHSSRFYRDKWRDEWDKNRTK